MQHEDAKCATIGWLLSKETKHLCDKIEKSTIITVMRLIWPR